MTSLPSIGTWVVGALAATTVSASAAMIDFTDNSIFATQTPTSATGSAGGFSFTITGSNAPLTYTPGPGPVAWLAGENDGIGIVNDEVGGLEYVTVTFDRKVRLTGVAFLDLFRQSGQDAEQAVVYTGVPPTTANFVAAFEATEMVTPSGTGFGTFDLLASSDTFTFDAGAGNDGIGIGDFALAGVTVAPVPVPASALLLGGAFGLLSLHRRRRAAA